MCTYEEVTHEICGVHGSEDDDDLLGIGTVSLKCWLLPMRLHNTKTQKNIIIK
jgi:hypothetical protein